VYLPINAMHVAVKEPGGLGQLGIERILAPSEPLAAQSRGPARGTRREERGDPDVR